MPVTVTVPTSLDDALTALEDEPAGLVLAGGTDLMVQVNEGVRRPGSVVALGGVDDLRRVHREGDELVIGAAVTYTGLMDDAVATLAPALAQAARTVGSPQIRNAGTIGGNLGTASPAGDTLPVLVALGATVVLASRSGTRALPIGDFLRGPKSTALAPGELILDVRIPVARGPQEYLKVGVRNAMVIAVASVSMVVDRDARHRRRRARIGGPDRARGTRRVRMARHAARLARRLRCRGVRDACRRRGASHRRPPRPRRVPPPRGRRHDPTCAPQVCDMNESYALRVNGETRDVHDAWIGESLLYVLRERLGLPGAKAGCEQGECGSCSVLLDGALVCSCLVLAASVVDREVITPEGLQSGERGVLTAVQRAFVEEGAVQCGFCTPGLVMAVHDLLERDPTPDDLAVREAVSGNLCRCTGYGRVLAAVRRAVDELEATS